MAGQKSVSSIKKKLSDTNGRWTMYYTREKRETSFDDNVTSSESVGQNDRHLDSSGDVSIAASFALFSTDSNKTTWCRQFTFH